MQKGACASKDSPLRPSCLCWPGRARVTEATQSPGAWFNLGYSHAGRGLLLRMRVSADGPLARRRLEDLAAGCFRPTGGFYRLLAATLQAQGEPERAAAALARAACSAP